MQTSSSNNYNLQHVLDNCSWIDTNFKNLILECLTFNDQIFQRIEATTSFDSSFYDRIEAIASSNIESNSIISTFSDDNDITKSDAALTTTDEFGTYEHIATTTTGEFDDCENIMDTDMGCDLDSDYSEELDTEELLARCNNLIIPALLDLDTDDDDVLEDTDDNSEAIDALLSNSAALINLANGALNGVIYNHSHDLLDNVQYDVFGELPYTEIYNTYDELYTINAYNATMTMKGPGCVLYFHETSDTWMPFLQYHSAVSEETSEHDDVFEALHPAHRCSPSPSPEPYLDDY